MENDDALTQRLQIDRPLSRLGLASGVRVFSRYTLEAQIGRGGMGVVWRAHDDRLERPVALKFLPPEVAADVEAVRDLKLETRRCLDLTHVNIVRVYDFIEENQTAALAMEYVEGESLAKLKVAAPGGCLAAADLVPIVGQICGALRYAHGVAKVVHHDLKPANVLVTREGVVKITDFGIARSLTDTQTRLTGRAGTTSGTPAYMSPQQLAGDKPTTGDDIYALGALLYELLTGKPPFFRGDALSVRQQVLERMPPSLEEHRADVGCSGPPIPADWAKVVLACLAKAPEARPAGAEEVANALGIPLAPFSPGRTSTMVRVQPVTEPPARRSLVPWLLSAGAVLVGLAATGIYFGVYRPEEQRLAAEQERLRQAALAVQVERARLAEEKQREAEERRKAAEAQALEERRKEEAARAQLAKQHEDYSAILARIAALTDSTPSQQINQTDRAVRTYLRTAPDMYSAAVEKAWADRQAAWRARAAAARPGSLLVETDPAGATVALYPRNERKTSPAVFDDVKPGDVTLRIEKEGFEPKDIPFVVKPGATNKLEPVRLVAIYGSIAVTSDPSDLYVVLEGNGYHFEGRTPFNSPMLPAGDYRVTYQRPGWRLQPRTVTVERGKPAAVFADLKGFELELVSRPAGAQIIVDRYSIGAAPKKISGFEPRDYQITATLEGYEVLTKTISVTKNERVMLTLVEKPLPRALRRITGQHWRYESFGTTAELSFTLQGKINGSHHSKLGGQVRDAGTVDAFNAGTNTFVAHFNANPGKALYGGTVQMQLVDDDHLALSWTTNGSTEKLVFARDKTAKK